MGCSSLGGNRPPARASKPAGGGGGGGATADVELLTAVAAPPMSKGVPGVSVAAEVLPSGGVAPGTAGAPQLMQAADEAGRLQAVRALQLIGAAPKPQFDAITKLMRETFETPVAAVSLLDEEVAFISRAGAWACSAGRAGSFCDWILVPHNPELLIVEDALQDARFQGNQYVQGEPGIRFYAGAPLVASVGGHRYGTLCVFDFKPRRFNVAKYQLLSAFSEILVREMERELMLSRQQQELVRMQSNRHLLRAMDCFHEGIVLLDLSSSAWQMVWANDAFRAAAGMPHLLSIPGCFNGSGAEAGSTGAGAVGALPQGPVDFWSAFSHATMGPQDSYNAALLAMSCGREFVMRVKPAERSSGGGSGGSHDAGDEKQQSTLTILFRPAEGDQLRAAMPSIGIPAWVGGGSTEGEDTPEAAAVHRQQNGGNGSSGSVSAAAGARQAPCYYFGIVQQEEEEEERDAQEAELQQQGEDREAALAFSAHSFSPTAQLSPTQFSGSPSNPGSESEMRESLGGLCLGEQELASGVIPAFFQMRPEVLSEVTLGPLIGAGSCGRCYRATWQGGRVCVKIIDCWCPRSGSPAGPCLDDSGGETVPQAAVVEALLARSLAHPHIMSTFTHGISTEERPEYQNKTHQQVWIVAEYCNRGSLLEAIDRGMLSQAPNQPNLPAILAAAQEIAGALSYLHAHDVIHGDLTPSNVLLTSATKDARRWVCKVADFGLSTILPGKADVMRSSSFGTVTHMPPELLTSGNLSKSVDVFSFGIIVLEMWHGRRAWLGSNPVQVFAQASAGVLPFIIPTDAPPALASLLRRCLASDPAQRPAFAEVLEEVQALARSQASRGAEPPRAAAAGAAPSPPQQREVAQQRTAGRGEPVPAGGRGPTSVAMPERASGSASQSPFAPPRSRMAGCPP